MHPDLGIMDDRTSRRFNPTPRTRRSEDGDEETEKEPELIKLKRYDFVVQFCWIPTTRSERKIIVEERLQAEAERAAAEAEGEPEDFPVNETSTEP